VSIEEASHGSPGPSATHAFVLWRENARGVPPPLADEIAAPETECGASGAALARGASCASPLTVNTRQRIIWGVRSGDLSLAVGL